MTNTVSEKRVNIRITASTSDFDKAIKKAQQQIEKLADTIDDMGKGKFGDNLEKQLEKVTDAAKDMQKQLEEMQESLDDMNKSKVDKLEKKLDDVSESAEDLNDTLEDTTDALEDMNKAKADKLEKQFDSTRKVVDKLDDKLRDVVDSLKDLDDIDIDDIRKSFENIRDANDDLKKDLENLANEFKDLDSQDLNKLENELDQIDTSIRDMRDGVKDAASDLDKHFQDVTSEVRDFDDAMDDIDYDSIDKIKDDVKDLDKFLEKSLGDMGDKSLNIETNVKTKGSDKGSLVSDLLPEVVGAEMVGNKVSSAVQEMTENLNKMTDSMKEMSNLTLQEQVKSYDDCINKLIDAQKEMEKLEKEYSDKSGQRSDIEAKMEESKKLKENNDKVLAEVNRKYTEALSELENFQKKYNEEVERINNINPDFKSHMDSLIALEKELRELTGADELISDFEKSLHNLGDSLYDNLGDFASKSKVIKQLSDELKGLKVLNEEDGDIELPFYGAFKEVDRHFQEFMPRMEANIDKLIKKLRDLGDVNLESLINDFESLWKSQDDLNILDDEDFDKLHNVYSKMTDDLKAMEEINADEPLRKIAEQGKGVIEVISAMVKGYRELDSLDESFAAAYGEKQNSIDQNRVEELKELIKAEKDYVKELERSNMVWKDSRGNTIDSSNLDRAMNNGRVTGSQPLNEFSYRDWAKELEEYQAELEKANKKVEEAREEQEKLTKEYEEAEKSLNKYESETQQLEADLNALRDAIANSNSELNKSADEFNEQYKAYEKLSQRVKDYLEDEKNAMVLREKVAKSFRDVADAMENVYSGSSKHNNADLINKTLEESVKHFKELNLISTENIQRDLNRLGEIIEDKTEKIKRFKEYNKEFGSDASKASYGIEKQGEALKEYADSIAFVIKETNVLQKAWGDISVGDVDHLKIRPRIELLDNYEKKLKSATDEIKEFYSKNQGPMTQKEQTTLEDWKIWEKNADKLKEYNRALEDYFTTIMDSGGNIDSRFLDELGKFDVAKFAKEFEKMGTTSVVLQKQFNANKIALQEWLQTEKEYRQEAVKSAKAALDQAENNKKLAKSQEEVAEATKKVEEAEEDLKKAKDALKNFIPDASKKVKELNEMAEALRKIGMAAEDLDKGDIAKFDKSLASMLDHLKTFDNDLPKSFGDLKEDIKAVFMDMNGLDFGGVFDGLKDIGAGILDKIPMKFKIAAGAAAALAKALKECADIGVNQFYKGMDTIKDALSGFIGVARDVGSEVKDAFENITGFNMDFSSLIEMPIDFESQMAKVGAIAGATGDDFKELEKKARELGSTTRYSATEVAEAMEYMGMAGWDNKQILAGLESVLNLATVAGMDLGQASDFVTDGLTALGYEAEDASKMVDILAKASTSSNTTVSQMQKAFTNCAPVAGTLGISMEDLALALGLMADKGVKGAKAGTALKNLMANLSAPTEKQLAFIKQFNLEGAQQDIVQGRLTEGIKKFKSALAGLSPQQQNAIITTIAGKEALSGVSALLNTTEEDLLSLESELKNCNGAAQEMAGTFDDTVKGALKGLASAMQETVLQIFDKVKGSIKDVAKQFTEFFNILNGYSSNGSGLADALSYLENVSQGWGTAITNGLTQAIGAIDNFVNSASLDNLLQVGTNIINGIANGIRNAAENGTLQSAITTAIQKIGTWFSENLETVVEVGKIIIDAITKGIRENSDLIGDIIKQVTDMQIEIDEAIAYEKGLLFGENFFTFFTKGIETKVSEWGATMSGFFDGLTTDFAKNAKMGTPTTSSKKKSNKKTSTSKKTVTDEVADQMNKGKVKTDKAASEIGKGISDNILKKLETMDAGDLKALNQEMKNLQDTVKSMSDGIGKSFGLIRESTRTEIVGMTNIFRNQFVNMTNIARNQMINVSNIIRNQAVNWANIIRNQVVNGRNSFTQQMMSMAAVARTQMVNVSNIIRNQSVNWANIIRNQAKKARDAFTSQMISMAKVASTQMGKVTKSIRGAMSQASSGVNVNVSRTVSTNYAMGRALSANALYAANNVSTASLGGNMGTLASSASYAMSTGGNGTSGGSSRGEGQELHMHVNVDGRELARASARYIDNELKAIAKRENRKRGAK